MKIIIAGCGKVGFTLAEQLAQEGHDLTIIDTNLDKLDSVQARLDVSCIEGNATSYMIQMEAGVEEADLLIAVTNQDEINMLSCLIAKKAGNCQTIARVRNPEYYKEINYIKEELGLSLAINPELAAAVNISQLIQVPSAMDIDTFAKGKVQLVRFSLPSESSWCKKRVSQAAADSGMLLCMIERNHQVIIPDGNTVLEGDDSVSVIIPPGKMGKVFSKIGLRERVIKSVIIMGGGMIAYYLSKILIDAHIDVKIIENNRARCEELSDALPKAMIIHGDATNTSLLREEGIGLADAVVSLTNFDEENIMLSLYASHVSKAKIITKINKVEYEGIIENIAVGSIVSPKFLTAEHIIQYVRSMQNSLGSNVETVYKMLDNRVEALEFYIRNESAVTNIPLSELKLKNHLLICSIVRNRKILVPSGQDKIQVGDTVIVVTTHIGLTDVKEILV